MYAIKSMNPEVRRTTTLAKGQETAVSGMGGIIERMRCKSINGRAVRCAPSVRAREVVNVVGVVIQSGV